MTNVELESVLAQVDHRLSAHIEWTRKTLEDMRESQKQLRDFLTELTKNFDQSEKRSRQVALLTTAALLLKDTDGDIRKAVLQAESLLTEIESGGEWAT